MSNGYLAAASADLATAHDIGDGFGLEVIDASTIGDFDTTASALAGAANLGLLLSHAAARDANFVALMQAVASRAKMAQLILVEPDADKAFSFLPNTWPAMQADDALRRSADARRRRAEAAPPPAPEPEPPAPPVNEAPVEQAPADEEHLADEGATSDTVTFDGGDDVATGGMPGGGETLDDLSATEEETAEAAPEPPKEDEEPVALGDAKPPEAPADEPSFQAPAPASVTPPPQEIAPQAPRARQSDDGYGRAIDMHSSVGSLSRSAGSAKADATAFAPKKLRRGTPELVRIAIHQPQDLNAVIKAARKADPRTTSAPQSMGIGDVALGSSVGVALEVKGASCEGAVQRRTWEGEPLEFSFAVEAEEDAKQAVILARVFVDDAQIGILAFTRPISGPAKKAASDGDRARLKRFKRVFISYSSADRETVAQIATAYQMAGVEHFFDRTSLKSGEEWSPRLRQEIDRADLFHLCWSKAASTSEWVEKEAEHALTRSHRSKGKQPQITVQMLDGPPWAPHPPHLDAINFDDFVRAAVVGYARGDGSN